MRSLAALFFAALLCASLGACATDPKAAVQAPPSQPRTTWVVGQDGRAIGQASFIEGPNGVLIRLEFSEGTLSPGWHGLHLHMRGDCTDAAAGFQASGGHIGMGGHVAHGLMNANGPEAGDLPNIFAPPVGLFAAEIFDSHVTLGPVEVNHRLPLLDADGSALIVHAGPDDQHSQPIGGAGPRVACAALTALP